MAFVKNGSYCTVPVQYLYSSSLGLVGEARGIRMCHLAYYAESKVS